MHYKDLSALYLELTALVAARIQAEEKASIKMSAAIRDATKDPSSKVLSDKVKAAIKVKGDASALTAEAKSLLSGVESNPDYKAFVEVGNNPKPVMREHLDNLIKSVQHLQKCLDKKDAELRGQKELIQQLKEKEKEKAKTNESNPFLHGFLLGAILGCAAGILF